MTDIVALRTAYVRLGFSNEAVESLVTREAIDSLAELTRLKDQDVSDLCSVIRKPGGMIPNPDAGNAGQPATIRNPGVNVPLKAETRLKLATYYLRHSERVSRPRTAADITVDNVLAVKTLKEREANWEKPDELPKIDEKDWVKTLEDIVEYLSLIQGSTGIPLSYVIRPNDKRIVTESANDPADKYPTPELEMISRAPHYVVPVASPPVTTQTFKDDNVLVMQILAGLFRDHKAYPYIKRANRVGDGRAAYQALHHHYLGQNSVDTQAGAAEKALADTVYLGKPRFSFETFVTIHKKQHDILENLKKYGYAGIDEGTKVRYLNDGIKAPFLEPAKYALKANTDYRGKFDKCVAYYKEAVAAHKHSARELNVSQFTGRAGRNGGRGGRGGRGTQGRGRSTSQKRKAGKGWDENTVEEEVEYRYYNNAEYSALKPGQKKKLNRLRGERTKEQDKTTAKIAALESENAALRASTGGAAETPQSGNRNNPNLTRQAGR